MTTGIKFCDMAGCETVLDGPEYETKCRPCYLVWAEDNLRECVDCGRKRISLASPEWRVRCGTCYINERNANCKPCGKCGVLAVKVDAPKWQKLCMKCFKLDRETNWRACSMCKRSSIRNREAVTVTKCYTCRHRTEMT